MAIADGQPLTRAGLKHLLDSRNNMSVVAEFDSAEALYASNEHLGADVLIVDHSSLDMVLPDGLKLLASRFIRTAVLIVSGDKEKENVIKVMSTGVQGYLTKSCSEAEILNAVNATAKGDKFFCNKVLDILMDSHLTKEVDCEPTNLTSRETEVLQHIARGLSSRQIADTLSLSLHTVNTHRKNILKKLRLKSPVELVRYALETGLVQA